MGTPDYHDSCVIILHTTNCWLPFAVDKQVKCEKWIRDDPKHFEESRTSLWLGRLMGRKRNVELDWPYPFLEEKFFVLTINTGMEGYHISVNGRHITSFAYRNVSIMLKFSSTAKLDITCFA